MDLGNRLRINNNNSPKLTEMLEMMPGSSLEKTNNNLSNIKCVPSNVSQQPAIEPDKPLNPSATSFILDLTTATQTNSTKTKKPLTYKKLSTKIEKKLIKLCNKYNINEKAAREKFKHLKRFTKDKRKPYRVLACKLCRIYFKSSRPKWYDRGVSKRKSNKQEPIADVTNVEAEVEISQDSNSLICDENPVSDDDTDHSDNDLVIDDVEGDEDIRNKIKLQLELLRQIRKPNSRSCSEYNEDSNEKPETNSTKNHEIIHKEHIENEEHIQEIIKSIENEENKNETNNKDTKTNELNFQEHKMNIENIPKIITDNQKINNVFEENCQEIKTVSEDIGQKTISIEDKEICLKTPIKIEVISEYEEYPNKKINANLSDVLISNESELSIISVVGGYISDEESKEEPPKPVNKSSFKRGTSIADILLKRELTSQAEGDIDASHMIVPTKTRDITKIKGWRSKHFTVINTESEEKSTVDEDTTTDDPICTNSSLEDPVPSTSTAVSLVEYKTQSQLDNILKQGENATTSNTKSAFVSDMLDTFLTNHSELKISYEVPKLVAEESITKPASIMPVENEYLKIASTKKVPKPKYIKKNTIKPKTLAEKRRMLELDRKNILLRDMEINEEIYIKRLEYCEKRNKIDDAKDIRSNLIVSQAPFSRHCWKMATNIDQQARQFAVVNGEKIRITGSGGGDNLFVKYVPNKPRLESTLIHSDKTSHCSQKKKYSLKRPIKYKPGPLSKKRKLMMKTTQTNDNWECHVLKMPKVKLVIYPEEGKPVPLMAARYLQLCRSKTGHINENWAQFAVSAVRCNDNTKTEIEFPIPYANKQNKLLVRKLGPAIHERVPPIYIDRFPHIDVDNCIKEIMTDMVKCVENQELDKAIIQNDPDLNDLINKNDIKDSRPPSPIHSMVQAIIKRPNVKRSKTSLELRRLNVQVIEVDVKEDEFKDISECKNDYCRLGCICKSLRCATSAPDHCGRVQCMLECSCAIGTIPRAHHSITLPAGTDILSASTVVRLQDEVNRNMAKEERKFSQTVIKANNQTIVVGDGARERQRRISKVPKKYSNYVHKVQRGISYNDMISTGLLYDDEDPDYEATKWAKMKPKTPEPELAIVEMKKPIPIWIKDSDSEKSFEMDDSDSKNCFVQLQKLNLEHVVPWCMVHNLYKCHCNGKETSNTILIDSKMFANESNITIDETAPPAPSEEYISYAPRLSSRYQPKATAPVAITDVNDDNSSRTRALKNNYYQTRNKSQTFRARYAKIKEKEKLNDTTELRRYLSDSLRIYEENKLQKLNQNENTDASKRKIANDTLEDDKQNKKLKIEDAKSDITNIVSAASFIDYERSYQGILTPAREWLDKFQKMLHVGLGNAVVHQIRLLEWSTLVSRQRSGKLQVWFSSKKLYNIVLTEDKRRPSRMHMNVKLFEKTPLKNFQVPEIISSLLRGKLPGVATQANETFVIIVKTGLFWEARGTIVLSNTSEMCKVRLANRPTPPYILVANLQEYETLVKIKSPTFIFGKEDIVPSATLIPINSSPAMSVEVVNPPKVPPLHIKIPKLLAPKMPATIIASTKITNSKKGPLKKAAKNLPPATVAPIYPYIIPRTFVKIAPKPLESTNKAIEITKLPLTPELKKNAKIPENTTPVVKRHNENILVPLPTGLGLNRWFMLILENDFSVLRIAFSNFHIKYTHLTTAIQMARNNKKTVRIRSQEKNSGEPPGNFGIYAVPDFNDKIFFGPYDNDAGHGLETFRFVNGRLVNTRIYNRWRGTNDRKTRGIWFTHNSTLNNSLSLEPQFDDCDLPSSIATAMTSPENAVKPQIEFVDLTGNDSDSETESKVEKFNPAHVDPLFNVLSADFSKKVVGDFTIEPVFDTVPVIPSGKTASSVACKKRKSSVELTPEKNKKQQLDNINLKDGHTNTSNNKSMNNESSSSIRRRMPSLRPIGELRSSDDSNEDVKQITYVITNIPGIGYFEIFYRNKRYILNFEYDNIPLQEFKTMKLTINWLYQKFYNHMFFMQNLTVRFSILETKDVPDMPKFNPNYLNGNHVICEKGIFDIIRMSMDDINGLGFNEMDTNLLINRKCDLLNQRKDELNSVEHEIFSTSDQAAILKIAPTEIKKMESTEYKLACEKSELIRKQQELMAKLSCLLKNVPDAYGIQIKKETLRIFKKNPRPKATEEKSETLKQLLFENVVGSGAGKYCQTGDGRLIVRPGSTMEKTTLPVGKYCKIVDGKMIVFDTITGNPNTEVSITKTPIISPSKQKQVKKSGMPTLQSRNQEFELLVPIDGLQLPVTVIGITPSSEKPSPSLLKKSKIVDLTDD